MGKIIYLPIAYDSKKITLAMLISLAEIACEHVRVISDRLRLQNAAKQDVNVKFRVSTDSSDPTVFFNAKASRVSDAQYEIIIGAGLLVHLDLIAQALVADDATLRGLRHGELLCDEAKAVGVEKVLRDFNFHFLIGGIFWHELAHIFLGHLDWLKLRRDETYMGELHMREFSEAEVDDYQVLEGDADRHAANWLLTSFDFSLSNNPFFRYRSEGDKFYDFGYLVASLFRVFDALESEVPSATRTHPENDVRIMVSVHFLSQYLEKYRPHEARALKIACAKGARAARENTFHANMREPDEMSIVLNTFQIDFRPRELGVRDHQLTMLAGPSSVTTFIQ